EVRRHGHVGTGPDQGALRRADVARAVVEDGDLCHRAPLVLGTPCWRGSISAASRSARANALNCASTMWCGSRPDSTRTCTHIAALNASVSKTCRVSEPA